MKIVKEKQVLDKLNVEIFIPLDQCACIYESFINRAFSVLTEYLNLIKFQTKSLASEEARNRNIKGNCVVLDENKIISNIFLLKKEIPKLLKEKGLL